MNFRELTPIRRNITTPVSHYSEHRDNLTIDFKKRCGYCNGINLYRTAPFEIDHFIPRKRNRTIFLTIKSETDYSNLIYSCKSCNNAKSNKWPTEDQNIPNKDDKGFIDPCEEEYGRQFSRLPNGRIVPTTKLGSWMLKELKLDKPQHEIIYNLEQLDKIIDELQPLICDLDNMDLYRRITQLLLKYRAYIRQLSDIR